MEKQKKTTTSTTPPFEFYESSIEAVAPHLLPTHKIPINTQLRPPLPSIPSHACAQAQALVFLLIIISNTRDHIHTSNNCSARTYLFLFFSPPAEKLSRTNRHER